MPGAPGLPGFDPRSGSMPGDSSGQRDGATGDLNGGSAGSSGGAGGQQGSGGGGDYTLDTLPTGGLGGTGNQQTAGTMTASERARVLDEQLRRGYEVFDGLILDERQRTQTEVDRQTGGQVGSGDIASAGGIGLPGGASLPQTLPSGTTGAQAGIPASSMPSSPPPAGETFPPPEDIPSGRDDDVVARQLREAAMREPDPELREALWDEYRKYTGISEQQ